MPSLQVYILNPKARKILKDLAYLKLISIKEIKKDDGFLKAIKKLRSKGKSYPISLEEITKEVEAVRMKRYVKKEVKG